MTKAGKVQRTIIFICQHFGTGVLMATAFVHLLPTAFTSLTDPCLPYFFNKGYRPLAGCIAMMAALVVVVLESWLTTRGASHSHSHSIWEGDGGGYADVPHHEDHHPSHSGYRRSDEIPLSDRGDTEGLVAGASPLPGASPRPGTTPLGPPNGCMTLQDGRSTSFESDRESLDLELSLEELQGSSGHKKQAQSQPLNHTTSDAPQQAPPNPDDQKRLMLQCLLLEAGILFHSVFIGMALSVATGPAFAVFLMAIAFHQCFEGLALGTRIAAIHFPRSSMRPWLMVLAFGATTPIGQAIGLFIHRFYDPLSQTGLLMVGFMNAISSGLLLFAGLVQLLAEDFLSEKSYTTLVGRNRVHAFLAVLGGAALMAGVGALA